MVINYGFVIGGFPHKRKCGAAGARQYSWVATLAFAILRSMSPDLPPTMLSKQQTVQASLNPARSSITCFPWSNSSTNRVSESREKEEGFSLFKSLVRVYRPTSDSQARKAEEALLRHAGYPLEDPKIFKQHRTVLGDGTDPLRFINTVILDQAGLDAPNSSRSIVVMVNGLGAAFGVFYQNMEPLSRMIPNSRVYAIDWLGTGRSGRPRYPDDPEQDSPMDGIKFFLDAFEEWRVAHGLERFILVGHSLGGYLSALYALWNPGRVEKLILASPAGLPPDHNTPEVEDAMGGTVAVNGQVVPGWIRWLWLRNWTPQCFVRWFGPIGPAMVRTYIRKRLPTLPLDDVPAFAEYMYHMTADVGSGEFALGTLMRPGAWAKEPLHDRLAELTMPVTFVYGSDDWMDHRHAEDAAKQMRVPVKIIRVPDSGHQLYLEQPEAFNKVVAAECIPTDETVQV